MDQLLLEEIADAAYAEARLDPERPHVTRLARALLGSEAIQRGPRPVLGPACLCRLDGCWRIIISHSLSPLYALFAVGHELGHWLLRREGLNAHDEASADFLGAALLAPRVAFRSAIQTVGEDLPALAGQLSMTETGAALRLAEVTGRPLAVVAPNRVRVRHRKDWTWPEDVVVRHWAHGQAPGLRKILLTDDPRRVVLDADRAQVA